MPAVKLYGGAEICLHYIGWVLAWELRWSERQFGSFRAEINLLLILGTETTQSFCCLARNTVIFQISFSRL